MNDSTVRFYFAFNSPYAFLASTRIEDALRDLPVSIEALPLYSPRTGPPPDFTSPKMSYLLEDVRRFAGAYDLRLVPGPFADTRKACLGFFHAAERGLEWAYLHAVYSKRWLEGEDIGDEAVLLEAARATGLEPDEFLYALRDGRHGEKIDSARERSESDRIFGIPSFVWRGERFWGNDRIEWLVRAIEESMPKRAVG